MKIPALGSWGVCDQSDTAETDRPVALVPEEAQPFVSQQAARLYRSCEQLTSPCCACSAVLSRAGASPAAPACGVTGEGQTLTPEHHVLLPAPSHLLSTKLAFPEQLQ